MKQNKQDKKDFQRKFADEKRSLDKLKAKLAEYALAPVGVEILTAAKLGKREVAYLFEAGFPATEVSHLLRGIPYGYQVSLRPQHLLISW